jgi:hypothetical protein
VGARLDPCFGLPLVGGLGLLGPAPLLEPDPASVIGPRVSIPHGLRRVAELVLLSVVGVRPPHDAIRWSGRANLTCVVQLLEAGHHRIHGFTRSMRPRDGTSLLGRL